MSETTSQRLTSAVMRALGAGNTSRWSAIPPGLTVAGTLPGGPASCNQVTGCTGVALFTRSDGNGAQEYACRQHVQEVNSGLRTLPGHPVKEGAGYDCCCGACLSLPARKAEATQ